MTRIPKRLSIIMEDRRVVDEDFEDPILFDDPDLSPDYADLKEDGVWAIQWYGEADQPYGEIEYEDDRPNEIFMEFSRIERYVDAVDDTRYRRSARKAAELDSYRSSQQFEDDLIKKLYWKTAMHETNNLGANPTSAARIERMAIDGDSDAISAISWKDDLWDEYENRKQQIQNASTPEEKEAIDNDFSDFKDLTVNIRDVLNRGRLS